MNLFEQIRQKVREIPKGKVSTYGEVAKSINIKDCRKVGWALHQNKKSSECPCHRVVYKNGELSKGYIFGGESVQRQTLQKEGVTFKNTKVDLNKHMFLFNK